MSALAVSPDGSTEVTESHLLDGLRDLSSSATEAALLLAELGRLGFSSSIGGAHATQRSL